MERLIATMQVGFATVASLIGSALAGERIEISPSDFDPLKPRSGRGRSGERTSVVQCGPNQMARWMSGLVDLV